MKMMNRVIALFMVVVLLVPFGCCAFAATEDGFDSTYTYNYDYWTEVRESPDAYAVKSVLYSNNLGLTTAINKAESLFVRGNDLYVVDTGNNRIIKIVCENDTYRVDKIIDHVNGSEITTFNSPFDVYVDENEVMYVCDKGNYRIVKMDKDQNVLYEYTKPTDSTFDAGINFSPSKLYVDVSGRVYCVADKVNKGIVKFETDGSFTGYVGANPVIYQFFEYIWRRWFMTEEQRAQTVSFVPTEYCNMYMDEDGFIYATNTSFSEYDLLYDNAKPIRKLNGIGNDILVKKDRYPPIGDLIWEEQGGEKTGPSQFVDITVMDNEMYFALDKVRGRIFCYDAQGIMVYAFGGRGNAAGNFNSAISIEHMGKDLLVLDRLANNITIFTPTEYGSLIFKAYDEYDTGRYEESAKTWKEVLKLNANYSLAFIGIGRSQIHEGEYLEAMKSFEMAHDQENYGRAFKYYRKIWIEENIGWVFAVIAILLIVPLCIKQFKKMKWEVAMYEQKRIRK